MHYSLLMAIELPKDKGVATAKEPTHTAVMDIVESLLDGSADGTSVEKLDVFAKQIPAKSDFETSIDMIADDMLAPYFQNTDNPAYLTLWDETDAGLEQYETGCVEYVRMPDGRILASYDCEFRRRYVLVDGLVYRHRFGKLHHRKRTKRAKQIKVMPSRPLKELYSTFDAFMRQHWGAEYDEATGRYGAYFNPNGMWDWYQVGGRWPFRFFTKCGLDMIIPSKGCYPDGTIPDKKTPEGYRWVVGARKADIAWDVMLNFYREEQREQFRRYEQWMSEGVVPKEYKRDYRICGDTIIYWSSVVYQKGVTEGEYLSRVGLGPECRYPINTAAILDGDGLHSLFDDDMEDYYKDDKVKQAWRKKVSDFIEKQPEDIVLLSIDCHT